MPKFDAMMRSNLLPIVSAAIGSLIGAGPGDSITFFGEGGKLANEVGDDPYRELARRTLTAGSAVESTADDAEPCLF